MRSVHWQTALAGCWVAAATCGCVTTWMPREDREAVPRQAATQGACPESIHASRPAYGVSLSVDRLPEVIQKVAPVYPEIAQQAGVDGTVIVAALVCEHGRVVETRVVKSIPMLDGAAEQSVYQWTYRPALQSGRPVPCWVEAPVRYSLH